ncbi:MAG: hypothetical protein J6S85_06700 [Methanobrevibacter sp.]|nr:hypothetical protein [Methanobrevibacter sp.]
MSTRLDALVFAIRLQGLDPNHDGYDLNAIIEFVEKHDVLLSSCCCEDLYEGIKQYLIDIYKGRITTKEQLDYIIQEAYKVGTGS